ncbi:hypothetical protein Nepgr_020827 [Nepenthes gracilis]|uniref:Protein kinase domain-containing protein n=1 Tax=Nepenthes gracilis TaxID=150966 RepID=A0AAD3SXZ7_NEPGR|nr:hypothetical protein Nepgr_020827 [Nepenthes gracilis]
MAFDQNLIPKDLRPLNTARVNGEETRTAPVTTLGWSPEGFYHIPPRSDISSPPAMPVYYTVTSSDAGFGGLGFANPGSNLVQAPAAPAWGPPMPACVGVLAPGIRSSGYAHSPNLRIPVSGNTTDQASDDGGEDSVSAKKVKFLCSFGGKILPRPSDGMLRYVGGQTRIISVRRDVSFGELVQKMADTHGQPVVIKYQLPDEDLDALVSVSCPDDLENMMEEYEKLVERSSDGSAKLRVFLFSASELDSSAMVEFVDLQDSGQRYVDAVNGIVEGVGGAITRKESIASATSTQNSDMSGTEAIDSSLLGQDITVPSSVSILSPKSDYSASNANSFKNILHPEIEIERSIPFPLQQQPSAYDLQQPGMKFPPPPSAYLPGYVDPHQDTMNCTDYQKLPSQVVYANPPVVATTGPVLVESQYHNKAPGFVPIAVTRPSSHFSIDPNMINPLMQQVVAVPADPSYNTYQARVPPAGAGGSYAPFCQGWMPQQPILLHEKTMMMGDCYFCQKQLPHVHSDNVIQDPRDSGSAAASDSIPAYRSLCVDDTSRIHQGSKVVLSGPLEEGTLERQTAGTGTRVGTSQADIFGVPQNLEAQHEINTFSSNIANNPEHPKLLAPQDVTGLPGDLHTPYGLAKGNIPLSCSEDDIQRHFLPPLSHVKQETSVTRPANDDHVAIGSVPLEAPEFLDIGAIDGAMGHLQVSLPEILSNREKSESPIDQPRKDDIFDHKSQLLIPGTNHEVAQTPFFRILGVNPQPKYVGQHIDGNPAITGVDSTVHMVDRVSPASDRRDDGARFQQVVAGLESLTTNAIVQPSMSPPNWGGDIIDSSNSLFSDQDPWNFRHDSHFPPPRPSKITMRKEASGTRDAYLQNRSGHVAESNAEEPFGDLVNLPTAIVNRDYSSEQAQSGKEELIKQELQATAEGVAASVLQSSGPSNADLSSYEKNLAVSDPSYDKELQNNNVAAMQAKLELGGMNIKPEKLNFGLPLSDGIGRLQIIKNSDLEELRELGSGTFGTVYHGKWRGTDVAIKRINDRCFSGKPSEQERMRDDFWNEAIKLADLHHPNVVAFYGVVLDGPGGSVATVTEYMVNGSLRNALQKNERILEKRKRLLIAMDVAFGMEYLHSKNIVHFDLKSDNLLVNLRDPHRPICKVGDLGLSKLKCQTLISGGVRGTLPWMAPELLNGSSSLVSEKVDVFSFGIVMWELLTGEEPYADLHYGAIIGGIVSNTLRPPIPDVCDSDWRSLMERCWSAEPSERPSFTDIANELRAITAKLPPKGQPATTNTKTNC